MTREEFNTKWQDHLEEGHYGLDIDNPKITHTIDNSFTVLERIVPEFKYSQIKEKFGYARVYLSPTTRSSVRNTAEELERKINAIWAAEQKASDDGL